MTFIETSKVKKLLPLLGGANKPFGAMALSERREAAAKIGDRIREKAFSRGLPIYIEINGQTIAEYANGHRFLIDEQGNQLPYNE